MARKSGFLLALLYLLPFTIAYQGTMHILKSDVVGSCGFIHYAKNPAVAISPALMDNGKDPKLNRKCGETINVYNPNTRQAHPALIVSTCWTCGDYDISVSEGLFKTIAPEAAMLAQKVAKGIDWGGQATGG